MAEVTKAGASYTPAVATVVTGAPSLATTLPCAAHQHAGLLAGEDIGAGDACYIKGSDGLVYRSTGAAANAAAVVDGFAAKASKSGEAVTLFFGVTFYYADFTGASINPGTNLFLSGTVAGGLATAASTGGTVPIARVLDGTRAYVRKSY